jgi:hypothetical protein
MSKTLNVAAVDQDVTARVVREMGKAFRYIDPRAREDVLEEVMYCICEANGWEYQYLPGTSEIVVNTIPSLLSTKQYMTLN